MDEIGKAQRSLDHRGGQLIAGLELDLQKPNVACASGLCEPPTL